MFIDTQQAAAQAPSQKSIVSAGKVADDFNNFLSLLTAQLQHQDPMAPMDNSTFVTQLAQLTQVEQAVQTNSNLEAITGILGTNGAMSETALIGKNVSTSSETFLMKNGSGEFEYELEKDSATVSAIISDEEGNVVRTLPLGSVAGQSRERVVWDGKDDLGLQLSDGSYSMEIAALDESEAAINYDTYASFGVTEIRYRDGGSFLHLENGETVQSFEVDMVS